MEQLITNIDSIILGFVQGSFGGVSGIVQTLWRLMFIVFIAFYGYKTIISGQFLISDLFSHMLKIIVLLVLATQWDAFFQFVYRTTTELPSDTAGQLMQAASASLGSHAKAGNDAASATTALSSFFDRGMTVSDKILEGAKWNDLGLFLYASVVWAGTIGLASYAVYLILFAKIGTAVFLAIGPFFILMLMFNNSRSLFEGWLKGLLSYAFVQIFVYVLLALLLAIMEAPMRHLEEHSGPYDKLVSVIGPFFLTAVISILLLAQVRNIASSVTGGVTLASLGSQAWAITKAKTRGSEGWQKFKGYTANRYEASRISLKQSLQKNREAV